MELGEPESLGMFHHHDRGVGNIDSHLNHRRGNENLNFPFLKLRHDGLFLIAFHPPMKQANPKFWKDILLKMFGHSGGILQVQFFRLLYQGVNDENLAALLHLLFNHSINFSPCRLGKDFGLHWHSARRHLINDGDIKISINGHGKCSRNGSCGHHQDIRVPPLLF